MIWFSASCTWTNLPNSVGLGFAFANDFRVRLEHAHDLAWKMRDSLEDPGLGLLHHLPHSLGHEFQGFRHLPHPLAATRCKMLHFLHHALGWFRIFRVTPRSSAYCFRLRSSRCGPGLAVGNAIPIT